MERPRLLVVSPRPPRADGRGDQLRAYQIVTALSQDWRVEVVSWLPDVECHGTWRHHRPSSVVRLLLLALVRPSQVAYVQSLAPRALRRRLAGRHETVLFITNRAVPRALPPRSVIDFVDDLGGAAERRAASSRGLAAQWWRWEARRTRRLDRELAGRSLLSVTTSAVDSAAISSSVKAIPNWMEARPRPGEVGGKIVFTGNLFYAPNHEAAMWICQELVPSLSRRGVEAGRVVISGRQPHPPLREAAATAGVELRPDVADLGNIVAESSVVLAPMSLGAGVQNKVLDAVGTGRACVLSPLANAGIGLVDGRSALIRERHPEPVADAVLTLLDDPALRRRLAQEAQAHLAHLAPETVAASWCSLLAGVRPGAPC